MKEHFARWRALAVAIAMITIAAPASASSSDSAARPAAQAISVGISMEYGRSVIAAYAGNRPRNINPRFVKLVDAMATQPVFRIGGDSTDLNHPTNSMAALRDRKFIALWQAVARDTHARLIFGVNFIANNPRLTLREARTIVRDFRPWLEAIEIGNEPEFYGHYPYRKFTRDFRRMINVLKPLHVPLAGPATGDPSWITRLPKGLERRLSLVTYHRYPLNNCITWPGDPHYPTVAHLENPASSRLPRVAQMAGQAHNLGVQFVIDELNSVTCEGRWGVSNSPYTRTWIRLTLENAQRAGVDAVNIHMWPGAPPNELFTTAATGLKTNPIYRGIMDYDHNVSASAPNQ